MQKEKEREEGGEEGHGLGREEAPFFFKDFWFGLLFLFEIKVLEDGKFEV